MELVRIRIGGLDDQVRSVAFPFRLSDLGNRVCPLLLYRFLRILAAEAQSLLDGFLPLVAAPLDFLQVTGKILLRGIVRRGTAALCAACSPVRSVVL